MNLKYSANILHVHITNLKHHIDRQQEQIVSHQQKIAAIQKEIDSATQHIVELEAAIKTIDEPAACTCGRRCSP